MAGVAFYPDWLRLRTINRSKQLLWMANNWHPSVTFNKGAGCQAWLVQNFDMAESLHNLFPENPELKLAEAVTHAAVNTETE